ncbi:DUF4238 domain-containing protein [Pseudomonas oryzihabitans]|uniref:DUF4238 domain-containing protein n=1 Tax=Pseudomonas oryzihabitans TaxID=47885 RepID=UPI003627EF87
MRQWQIRKINHYVWAHYLRGWANANKDIYHRSNNGISATNSKVLACEYGFYKMSPVSEADEQLLLTWISAFDAKLQPIHRALLAKVMEASWAYHAYGEAEYEVGQEMLAYNLMENLHTCFEDAGRPVLDELRRGNYAYMRSGLEAAEGFHSYLGQQMTRTQQWKNNAITSASMAPEALRYLVEKHWWLLSFMLGVNVGAKLCVTAMLGHFVILENQTKLSFVTSDNPVINIHPHALSSRGEEDPVGHSDVYFPISPTLAYIVSEHDTYGQGAKTASEGLVRRLNSEMRRRSNKTLFADSREIIKATKMPSLFNAEDFANDLV